MDELKPAFEFGFKINTVPMTASGRTRHGKSGGVFTDKKHRDHLKLIHDAAVDYVLSKDFDCPHVGYIDLNLHIIKKYPTDGSSYLFPLQGDNDNYIKMVKDGLNKALYTDDKWIVKDTTQKFYTNSSMGPEYLEEGYYIFGTAYEFATAEDLIKSWCLKRESFVETNGVLTYVKQ
jgi:Holliday junction resolvase RusA-like endonuclease